MRSAGLRPLRLVALVLATCIGVAFAVPPASAQTADDKRSEAKQIAERLAELEDEQMELGAKYERATYERHLAEQRAAEAQAQADAANAEIDQRREELRDFAVSAYAAGNDGPMGAALSAEEATSGAVKGYYLETATGDRGDLIDALKSAQRAAEDDVERLEAARAEAESYAEEIESARSAAAEATDKQSALNARVQGELASLVAAEAATLAARNPQSASGSTPNLGATTSAPTASPAPLRPAPSPAPPAPNPTPAPPPPSGSKAAGAISAGLTRIGSPYVWGAAGPSTFDCSGFVLWAYAQVGVSLPHYSGAQYNSTTRISAAQLQPGDLVFWGPGGSDHVALYMGGNQIVHAFSSARSVQVTHLAGWWKTPSGYGRLNY